MNETANPKQQIVEQIKSNSTVLVTVGRDPSVDELTAALGLTLMLSKLKKHATAVVSGAIPPAIDFLEPGKTFENTVDSLRDFIIALDKEKADHLRYKVDGDVVKIFITPYKTTISENDLDFSQGDYNVELVLALGVKDEAHLDTALESHGRILHDATVATISCGSETSKLGSINWSEASASSISEMLVSLSEALKGDKPLLDEQVSTAFLTGIVAATDRFSNNKTSSKVMTMAAQLMAAGANQQLIAAKLEEAHEISDSSSADENGNQSDMSEGDNTPEATPEDNSETESDETSNDGSLSISHEMKGNLDEVAAQVDASNTQAATEEAEKALSEQLADITPETVAASPSVEDLQKDIQAASNDVSAAADEPNVQPVQDTTSVTDSDLSYEPSMGGTLNATTEEAAEDKRREDESSRNHTILSHGSAPLGEQPGRLNDAPFGASSAAPAIRATDDNTPATARVPDLQPLSTFSSGTENAAAPLSETLADLDKALRTPHDEARAAVEAALANDAPSNPFGSALPPEVVQPAAQPTDMGPFAQTQPQSEPLPAPSGLPPLPDFTTLPPPPPQAPGISDAPPFPPQPPEQLGHEFQTPPELPEQPQNSNDPSQFRIPGQS